MGGRGEGGGIIHSFRTTFSNYGIAYVKVEFRPIINTYVPAYYYNPHISIGLQLK